jgi:hypothetical protein
MYQAPLLRGIDSLQQAISDLRDACASVLKSKPQISMHIHRIEETISYQPI